MQWPGFCMCVSTQSLGLGAQLCVAAVPLVCCWQAYAQALTRSSRPAFLDDVEVGQTRWLHLRVQLCRGILWRLHSTVCLSKGRLQLLRGGAGAWKRDALPPVQLQLTCGQPAMQGKQTALCVLTQLSASLEPAGDAVLPSRPYFGRAGLWAQRCCCVPAFCCFVCAQVYIEGLYEEELPQRAAAADMLCQLFRNSGNMQVGGAAAHNDARWWLWLSWNSVRTHTCMRAFHARDSCGASGALVITQLS